ncbi:hypothetical protein MMC29_005404, partial [Sticta canariensis]|nr:hypothetical protein [Sticta canariensis]
MPHDDYTASTGGALKLKGVGSASKISKPHKKKRPKPPQRAEFSDRALGTEEQAEKVVEDETVGERSPGMKDGGEQRKIEEVDGMRMGEEDVEEGVILRAVGKTEAERRHEERRRKRLDERLKREGIKTHKERVEELNRYLSNLSEHHDMYVLALPSVPVHDLF